MEHGAHYVSRRDWREKRDWRDWREKRDWRDGGRRAKVRNQKTEVLLWERLSPAPETVLA
ncbi:MAG: hypothetical protein ACERK9_01610 [Deltaproteobacteria bacterium]